MTGAAVSAFDYYQALEQALSALTYLRGEYRRHFGCSQTPPPKGYCWFKGVVSPERHPDYAEWACSAAAELESRFLSELPRLKPRSVLDIGCGNGAMLRHLADTNAGTLLCGINFQPLQVRTARKLLEGTSVEIIEADFLRHSFARRFELVCLVESAFHMPYKAELCRRIADVLAPGGEVWLLDIVIAERASSAFQMLGRDQTLFNYIPRTEWRSLFADQGLEEFEFVDLSRGVVEFLQVSEISVLRDEYFVPRMTSTLCEASMRARDQAEANASLELLVQIATQYRRMARLLRGGMLEYALMRYRSRT